MKLALSTEVRPSHAQRKLRATSVLAAAAGGAAGGEGEHAAGDPQQQVHEHTCVDSSQSQRQPRTHSPGARPAGSLSESTTSSEYRSPTPEPEHVHATEIDDELSLTDLSPTRDVVATPPREGKVAYVVGEEESLYTSAAEARRLAEISFTRVESGNDNSDDHQVDVHRCASATCQICEGRGMTFVGLYEEAATAEGHEFSYRGPYEPRDDATAPEYDNPAALARTYVVEDTVEF